MPTHDEIAVFSLKIEAIANTKNILCTEAIVDYCEESGMEILTAASLVSTHLKSRIQDESQSLNLLKKTSRLPL
jgi:hypothetical protein